MDSIISWFILLIGSSVSGFWLIIKAIEQKERYHSENVDFFKNKK